MPFNLSFGFNKKREQIGDADKNVADISRHKICYIFAGINGSGKSSLHDSANIPSELGIRVSIDEIARSMGVVTGAGDWRSPLVQIMAGRAAIKLIYNCIDEGETFNQETTLPGAAIVRQLNYAKRHGFQIVMYFIGVANVETAIERVHHRIAQGGHGIDDRVIRKRWGDMPGNVRKILPLCDVAHFYDNTERFEQIAVFVQGDLISAAQNLPAWFTDITGILGIEK